MRRNLGIAILRIAEWSVTGTVVAGVLYLLATDQLYEWRTEAHGPPTAAAAQIVTGSLPSTSLERSRPRLDRESCLDLIDIATDADLGVRSADFILGWMAARRAMMVSVSKQWP